jgi:hypothetical protein
MFDPNLPIGVASKTILPGDEIIITIKGNEIVCDKIEFNENGRQAMIEKIIKEVK